MATQKRTLLDNRHPDYEKMAPSWAFWQASYNGGAEYDAGENLFRFPRETEKNYDERKKRAARMNYTRQVQDLIVQYLTKEAPDRKKDAASQPVQDFWENCDRQGKSLDDFMRDVAVWIGVYGNQYLVVDNPTGVAVNKAEQDAKGLKPYVYSVSPLDMLDFVRDPITGYITQALVREYYRAPVNLLEPREGDEKQVRYRVWVNTESGVYWALYVLDKDKQPLKTADGILGINRVPIIEVVKTGRSMIDDVSTLDRQVYNYNSLIDQIAYDQTFSTLCMPWTNGSTEDFYDNWELKLGTKSILPYQAENGQMPTYISPDAAQASILIQAVEKKITTIYQAKNLQDTVGSAQQNGGNVSAQSGIAKGYDFEKLNAGLAQYADDLEKADEQLAELVGLWMGETKAIAPDLIDYPDTFDTKTLMQDLTEYAQLQINVQSPTFKKIQQKKLVKKADPKMDKANFDIVMTEIDASQDPAEIAAAQQNQRNKLGA